MGPWSSDQIRVARQVSFLAILEFLGAYVKRDKDYMPLDRSRQSIRIQVGYEGKDFRFILTGEKWINELLEGDHPERGGGGAIDFVRHVTGVGFVQAVKVCLDAQVTAFRRLT